MPSNTEKTRQLEVINCIPDSDGWSPIHHAIKLLSHYFDAQVINLMKPPSFLQKARYRFRRRVRSVNKPHAIIVVPTVARAHYICYLEKLDSRYNKIALWVVDSPFTEKVPSIPLSHLVDLLYVTSSEDIEHYRRQSGLPVRLMSRGSDVLGFGGFDMPKDIDLLRIGRQPDEWDDDESNARWASNLGISYEGRPPFTEYQGSKNGGLMHNYLKRTKFVLAHSNLVDSSKYTHHNREYITERWLDALACGCIIVGVPPRSDNMYKDQMWEGALLELENPDRKSGFQKIHEQLSQWNEAAAIRNYTESRRRFDWRYRFEQLAEEFNLDRSKLDIDLKHLNDKSL